MAYELGVAYLPILPETSKIAPGIKQALGDATKGADKQGSAIGGMVATGLKTTVKAGLAGGALFAGIAGKKGIDRLLGIEDARASLSGLGHDAKAIDSIMSNALDSVKGTAYGMADAGKLAATAVAAGIEPGKELTKYLKLTADTAAITGSSLADVGNVMNNVETVGSAYNDSLQILAQKGLPIYTWLAESMGVSTDAVKTLASEGKISSEQFRQAIETNIGGAALKSGDTTTGAWSNMWASVGRVAANLLSGVFPKIRGGFQSMTDWLGPLEEKSKAWGQTLGDLGSKYGPKVASVLGDVAGALQGTAKFLGRVVKFAWDYKDVLAVLAVGLLAYKGHLIATRVAETALALWRGRQLIAMYAVTVAQGAMNAVMAANPISLVIIALTALGAGLVIAYKKSETFRNIVNGTWAAIKAGLSAAWSFIQPILSSFADWVGPKLSASFNVLKTVVGVAFEFIKTYVSTWWTVLSAVFSAVVWYVSNVLAPIFTWLWQNVIGPVFGFIGDAISWAWTNVVRPTFDALGGGVGGLVTAFTAAKDGIKGAWDLLVGIVEGPINLAKGIIAGFIDLINQIPGVSIPNPFVGGKTRGGGNKSNLASVLLPSGRNYAEGGWTGPGGKFTPAGLVHADEFVISKAARRQIESQAPGVLDYMNKTGQLPLHGSYAGGGRVVPGQGKQHKSGYPWATWAGDYPNPTGTPVNAWKSGVIALVKSMTTSYGKHIRMTHGDGTSSLYAHLSSFAKSVGDRVSQGEMIGRVGSTGNSTGPHLHFEALGGSFDSMASGGSIWDSIKTAGGQISGWVQSKLLDKANIGGLFGNVSGLMGSVGNGVKDWVLDKLFDSGGLAAGTGFMAKNTIAPERVLSDRQTRAFEQMVRHNFGEGAASGLTRDDLDYLADRIGETVLAGSRNVAASTVSDFSDRRRTDELWGTR